MTSMNFNETLSLQQYESYLINKMHYWSHKQRPISDLDTAPSVNYKPDQFTMSLTKMKSLKKELLCHLQLILGVTNTTNFRVPSKECPGIVIERGTVDIE